MRDFAKISPSFWTGTTGKELRRRGSEALVVSVYLMTSPHSNMLGLYYQPELYMAHETGLGIEGASKGLQHCIDVGFCKYDQATEIVWVVEMAAYQIAESLKATDKRCSGIQKDYDALPNNPFVGEFFDRYKGAFNLQRGRIFEGANTSILQAPSMPHRSKEKEKEKEKEIVGPSEGASESTANLTVSDLIAEGIDSKLAGDWLKVRKAKKAPLTRTAWDGVKREAAIAGLTPPEAVKIAAENSWQGFKASWLQPKTHNGQKVVDPFEVAH